MASLSPCIRSLRHALAPVAALVLAACAVPSKAPDASARPSDPALQDHARWCGTNPPSGYCDIDDHR